jgi:hypothetical protein
MEERIILTEVITNYEELVRILRKTEYETYLGELKSKLNKLLFQRILNETITASITSPIMLINIFPNKFPSEKRISELKEEFNNAKRPIEVSEEIQDKVFSLFKNYINQNKDFELLVEAEKTNALIKISIFETLENSIIYQIKKIKSRINEGRFYLAQMKDSERRYDKIIEKFEDIKEENIEINTEHLEEIYDETIDTIYESDLAIKDSKWLRLTVYFGLLIGILALIFALIQYFTPN